MKTWLQPWWLLSSLGLESRACRTLTLFRGHTVVVPLLVFSLPTTAQSGRFDDEESQATDDDEDDEDDEDDDDEDEDEFGSFVPPTSRDSITAFFENFDFDWRDRGWRYPEKMMFVNDKWRVGFPVAPKEYRAQGDEGLIMAQPAAHHVISAPFQNPFEPFTSQSPLIVQYEVRFGERPECIGAYLKVVSSSSSSSSFEPATFGSTTPYTVMFGPDKCDSTAKVQSFVILRPVRFISPPFLLASVYVLAIHFKRYLSAQVHLILAYTNKKSGKTSYHHLKDSPRPPIDKWTHLYTLKIRFVSSFAFVFNEILCIMFSSGGDFSVSIDEAVVKSGSLDGVGKASLFDPAFPPETGRRKTINWSLSPIAICRFAEIDDPKDVKPSDWVDLEVRAGFSRLTSSMLH